MAVIYFDLKKMIDIHLFIQLSWIEWDGMGQCSLRSKRLKHSINVIESNVASFISIFPLDKFYDAVLFMFFIRDGLI